MASGLAGVASLTGAAHALPDLEIGQMRMTGVCRDHDFHAQETDQLAQPGDPCQVGTQISEVLGGYI
jgi:hypothetical protein